jgi:hypothetical protein
MSHQCRQTQQCGCFPFLKLLCQSVIHDMVAPHTHTERKYTLVLTATSIIKCDQGTDFLVKRTPFSSTLHVDEGTDPCNIVITEIMPHVDISGRAKKPPHVPGLLFQHLRQRTFKATNEVCSGTVLLGVPAALLF